MAGYARSPMSQWDPPQEREEPKPAPIDKQLFGFPIWGWLIVVAAIALAIGWGFDGFGWLFGDD